MKILKLKALNINSLKGETVVDFTKLLNDNALFAITGPTGAGKSTILDIITCALYGRTPRLKNPNELMARHTGECYCEVEFEIKGDVYRSSWTQKRARKSASGKFQSAKMELSDVQSDKVLKSTLRDVPKYVEELSGLDFDRFIQSMMLAQGSFDAFLKAKESDRSTLLEKITGTQIYAKISKEIYDTYIESKTQIDSDKKVLENTIILEPLELENKLECLRKSKKDKTILDVKVKELLFVQTWIETLQKLKSDSIKYDELYMSIIKEKEDKKEVFEKLALANKALNIQDIYQKYNNISTLLINQKEKLIQFNTEYTTLKANLQITKTSYEGMQKEYEKEKISFTLNNEKLKEIRALKEQVKSKEKLQSTIKTKLYTYKKELACVFDIDLSLIEENESFININCAKLKNKSQLSFEKLTLCEKEYISLESFVLEAVNKEQSYRQGLSKIELLQNTIVEYEKIIEDIQKEKVLLIKLTEQIKIDTSSKNEKQKLITQIELTLDTLVQKRENELLIIKYENDRKKLHENDECFLCGSKSHPYIEHSITLNIDESTSKIEEQKLLLKNEKESLTIYENKLLLNNKKAEDTKLELEKIDNKKIKIEQYFEDSSFIFEINSHLLLEEEKENIEKELKKIIILREQKDSKQKEKENLQKEYHLLQEQNIQIDSIIKSFEENKNELSVLINELGVLEKKSKTILDIDDVDVFEKTITKTYSDIQTKYNDTSKELTFLETKEQSLCTQIQELSIKQTNDELDSKKLKNEFDEVLKANDFTSKVEFESALLSNEKREELFLFCKDIEQRYTSYKTLQLETETKLKEHNKEGNEITSNKSLEEIKEELSELKEKNDELQKSIGSIEKELEIDTSNRKNNEEKIQVLEKKKEHFKVWVKLNEMIGSADGNKFAKFAQGITLDQLINLANNHLNVLSNRYELSRSSDEKQLLEIEVRDSFQGDVIRPVSTLSGGESFIVSLSLALGLSELASQKIAIDSLFLDEGFGTLDEDSLETALNALNLLQSRGKMVGVISHVEALKERIPLQIKVIPKGDGTSFIEMN